MKISEKTQKIYKYIQDNNLENYYLSMRTEQAFDDPSEGICVARYDKNKKPNVEYFSVDEFMNHFKIS